MSLVERIIERARAVNARLVLPESGDPRILEAAGRISGEGIARCVLLGSRDEVDRLALENGISLNGCEVLDPASSAQLDNYAELYGTGPRRVKPGVAIRAVRKPLYYGAMMVKAGDADVMVAGAASPTRRVIEAASLCIGPAPGIGLPTSFFLMDFPDRPPLIFADCAVNVDPTTEELADIAITSAGSAELVLGETARVAMLSLSTKGSASHEKVAKVKAALDIVRTRRPDLLADGELQADAALVPEVAAAKIKDESEVAGKANVLIFPDLDAGNIAYKLVQYLAGATATGPILQGFSRPVADLSRGATVDDVIAVTAVTIALSR